jgi:segregation and condensation protein B
VSEQDLPELTEAPLPDAEPLPPTPRPEPAPQASEVVEVAAPTPQAPLPDAEPLPAHGPRTEEPGAAPLATAEHEDADAGEPEAPDAAAAEEGPLPVAVGAAVLAVAPEGADASEGKAPGDAVEDGSTPDAVDAAVPAAAPEGADAGEPGPGGVVEEGAASGTAESEEPGGVVEGGVVPLSDGELERALEALLLVVDSPADEESLAAALDTTPLRVAEHLRLLADRYTDEDRGIDLRRAGGGWRFYTRDRYAPYVEKLLLDGQRAKLTRAALETLAVIAYRQPVTRARVAAVRGVNCDGVIRTLLARGLVEETGTDLETGGFLYRTTELFLERLGLSSLDDLPPIAPLLPEVDSIDEL